MNTLEYNFLNIDIRDYAQNTIIKIIMKFTQIRKEKLSVRFVKSYEYSKKRKFYDIIVLHLYNNCVKYRTRKPHKNYYVLKKGPLFEQTTKLKKLNKIIEIY